MPNDRDDTSTSWTTGPHPRHININTRHRSDTQNYITKKRAFGSLVLNDMKTHTHTALTRHLAMGQIRCLCIVSKMSRSCAAALTARSCCGVTSQTSPDEKIAAHDMGNNIRHYLEHLVQHRLIISRGMTSTFLHHQREHSFI